MRTLIPKMSMYFISHECAHRVFHMKSIFGLARSLRPVSKVHSFSGPAPFICIKATVASRLSCTQGNLSRVHLLSIFLMQSILPQRSSGMDNAYLKVVIDPTNEDKAWNLYDIPEPLEIEPQQEHESRGIRQCFTPEIPLEAVHNLVLHRLESFEDSKLNFGAFPRLRTLVIHIILDRDILNANFSGMTDKRVFEFVNNYIWHARRHRSFRDNLHKLYSMPLLENLKAVDCMKFSGNLKALCYNMELKSRNFSLKIRMSDSGCLNYILVNLDNWEVERVRGKQSLPESSMSSPRSWTLPRCESRPKLDAHFQFVKMNPTRYPRRAIPRTPKDFEQRPSQWIWMGRAERQELVRRALLLK